MPGGDQVSHFPHQIRYQLFAADAEAAQALNPRQGSLTRSGI
jgi:hypothetical protein